MGGRAEGRRAALRALILLQIQSNLGLSGRCIPKSSGAQERYSASKVSRMRPFHPRSRGSPAIGTSAQLRTTWALTTCDSFRNRQRNPSAPGCLVRSGMLPVDRQNVGPRRKRFLEVATALDSEFKKQENSGVYTNGWACTHYHQSLYMQAFLVAVRGWRWVAVWCCDGARAGGDAVVTARLRAQKPPNRV